MTLFVRLRDSGKVRIYALGTDIMSNWEYIRTQSADMNELYKIARSPLKNKALGG